MHLFLNVGAWDKEGSSDLVNFLGQIISVMAPLLPWSLQFVCRFNSGSNLVHDSNLI